MNDGIPYFPLDTHLDDKFELIEAEFGLTGFSVIVKLYQKIYGGFGYYCEWTKDVALLFGKRLGLGGNAVSEIVDAAIRRGIFDADKYEIYQILTSAGIQNRYFEAVSRRKSVGVKKQYLLVKLGEKYKNVYISEKNADISSKNADILGQSKEEERRVKESIEEEKAALLEIIQAVYKSGITKGKVMPAAILNDIHYWLGETESGVILWAISVAEMNNALNWSYVRAVLRNAVDAGVKTAADLERYKKRGKRDERATSIYTDDDTDYAEIERRMNEKY